MLNFSFLGTEILYVCLCSMAEVLQLEVKKKYYYFFLEYLIEKRWSGWVLIRPQ